MSFAVSEDGLLREDSVHTSAQRMRDTIPWVDPDAFEAFVMIIRANLACARSLAPILEEFELSGARFSVLRVLNGAPGGRLLMGEIAKSLFVSPTNVTRLVNGLSKDGLVRRVRHPEDGRASYIELTEEGIQRFRRTVPVRQQRLTEDFSRLSTHEKRLLIHLLSKLIMNPDKDTVDGVSQKDIKLARAGKTGAGRSRSSVDWDAQDRWPV
jgi:DNA-binding MarR family transcriptional regulator